MSYIEGIYVKDIYMNKDNGFLVGLFRVKNSNIESLIGRVLKFTGNFDGLRYKTMYRMNGEIIDNVKYGESFSVSSYEVILPTEEEEIIEFLSSDLFPIGESTAKKIVDKLGVKCIDIIIENPDSLSGIPRLGDSKIEKIYETLIDYKQTSRIILNLQKMGFSTKNSLSILKVYGVSAEKVIEENIYQIRDRVDIPFLEVDNIAINIGYKFDDERRLLALVLFLMDSITFNMGDTYSFFDEIYDSVYKYADISRDDLMYILLKLEKMGKIVIKDDRYYLEVFYRYEEYIAKRLIALSKRDNRNLPKINKKIEELEFVNNIQYDDMQKMAIKAALNNNLTIITGGPGTGKTTIVKCIVKLLLDIYKIDEKKIALLAPTGRAARKLMQTTGIPAYTIHKYLRWDKDKNVFEVNEYSPNKEEYIIVDESSMIDTVLLASLLKGTSKMAKYIFVGDYYQLPSVSQGQILKDMIDSNKLNTIKLNSIYRQSEGSYIVTLAKEVKEKNLSSEFLNLKDDYNFIKSNDASILDNIKKIVSVALEKGYCEQDIQVLAPIYKTRNGIDNLNKSLQEIFNPKSPKKNEIESGSVIYREGDKIMQLVNDSDNGISNGDIGYIESIRVGIKSKSGKNEMCINFDGTRVTYTPKDFINITHGYAISIHKSQGGEFKMVIIPFVPAFKIMLYNKLIYTAITRAKEKLILIGDVNSFIYGIENNYIENRKTTLKEMLINMYN